MTNEPATPPLGLLLRHAHMRSARAFADALHPLGLEPPGAGILLNLDLLGPLTQRQLIDVTGTDKSSMVRYIDGLEHHGLVRREAHPTDRRALLITLTDASRAILEQIRAAADRTEQQLTQGLTPLESATLHTLLSRLAAYPDRSPGSPSAT